MTLGQRAECQRRWPYPCPLGGTSATLFTRGTPLPRRRTAISALGWGAQFVNSRLHSRRVNVGSEVTGANSTGSVQPFGGNDAASRVRSRAHCPHSWMLAVQNGCGQWLSALVTKATNRESPRGLARPCLGPPGSWAYTKGSGHLRRPSDKPDRELGSGKWPGCPGPVGPAIAVPAQQAGDSGCCTNHAHTTFHRASSSGGHLLAHRWAGWYGIGRQAWEYPANNAI